MATSASVEGSGTAVTVTKVCVTEAGNWLPRKLSGLEIFRSEAGSPRDPGQHARSDLLAVVERKDIIRPVVA